MDEEETSWSGMRSPHSLSVKAKEQDRQFQRMKSLRVFASSVYFDISVSLQRTNNWKRSEPLLNCSAGTGSARPLG